MGIAFAYRSFDLGFPRLRNSNESILHSQICRPYDSHGHNVDDIDDRGVIEIPASNDTVIYQDEEGQYYEIPTSDLIEYDGDDGEITYHSKSKKRKPKMVLSHTLKDRVPPQILAKQNIQLAMVQAMYGRVFS